MNELIKVKKGTMSIPAEVAQKIVDIETQIKELKAAEDELKAALLNEMETKSILKIDNDVLSITYIASTDREIFDSKALREEKPDIYDEYVKLSTVKPSIRIKVK